jgi:hypothetical protein
MPDVRWATWLAKLVMARMQLENCVWLEMSWAQSDSVALMMAWSARPMLTRKAMLARTCSITVVHFSKVSGAWRAGG